MKQLRLFPCPVLARRRAYRFERVTLAPPINPRTLPRGIRFGAAVTASRYITRQSHRINP